MEVKSESKKVFFLGKDCKFFSAVAKRVGDRHPAVMQGIACQHPYVLQNHEVPTRED